MSTILYSQSNLPTLQNRVFKTVQQAENCPLGDIEIVEDYETGLVYNASFNPELVVYDSDYDNEQAVSPAFQEHLQSVADLIETELGLTGLIEVGCGKGFFLELLLQRNFDITGFDPTYQGSNPRIIKELFRPGLLGAARGLILRHVLEHIQNPVDFLLQLAEANGGGGLIYIEVPCFDWICERKAWFDIFYEHVNYFRISDFRNMFSRLLFAEKTFSGQYISVVADLSSLRKPQFSKENSVTFPEDFLESLPTKGSLEGDDKMVAVWGGGSKGVIFSVINRRVGNAIDLVVDVNPRKHGKFLPISGLLVSSPSEANEKLPQGATVYVMNSNYLEEIREMTNNRFNYLAVDA